MRIIKKYPNRRLYDTESSAYITLEGIRRLVLTGSPFKVVDNKTGADITRAILLQIISEREEKGAPVLTTDLLQSIIRFYGDSLQSQGILGEYLQQSMDFFLDQQNRIRAAADPVALMSEMTNRSLNFWNNFFPGASGGSNRDKSSNH
ncbi:MAG: polyhydroxyalkanoate synthesis repressor PhaR [Magnetococcales bacterium]|nr:polyhydroxyalkanoate synthesis repressor PhaR [Magnetococcales bacterium]MBF0151158.1 polyhydroxyalkanoate synthesis repressor PhaR [Magnetococcales bacterium]MBF0172528.1 polyhydroxyalkanoate synthesis repressor PhaR [Magnetococcales bacterium]MBF0629981.1 polyhydroxyalkanoate synthesis repressor PhaR [Magnetococcales bacterium]